MHLPVFSQIETFLIFIGTWISALTGSVLLFASGIESRVLRFLSTISFVPIVTFVGLVSLFVMNTIHIAFRTVHDFIYAHIAVLRQDIVEVEGRF